MLSAQRPEFVNGSNGGNMSHTVTERDAQDEQDDLLIGELLNAENTGKTKLDVSRELEPGEKAEDAVDYMDMSDDDLAEDEDLGKGDSSSTEKADLPGESFEDIIGLTQDDDLPELTNGSGPEGDGLEDLFGDMPSSPVDLEGGNNVGQHATQSTLPFDFEDDEHFQDSSKALVDTQETKLSVSDHALYRPVEFTAKDAALSKEQQMQQELFAMSRSGFGGADFLPAPPENQEELLASLWPRFERNTVPRFMNLLPPKKARYVGKIPVKKPKSIQPTKVSLDIGFDQEKSFRVSSGGIKRSREDAERHGLVVIQELVSAEKVSDDDVDMESDYENEPVGGVTWQDLQILCEDWDTHSSAMSPSPERETPQSAAPGDQEDLFRGIDQDWEIQRGQPFAKKRRLTNSVADILGTPHFAFPSLHEPEQLTAKIAKTVTLDLNDPQLLIANVKPDVDRPDLQVQRTDLGRSARGGFSKTLGQRYNISNDEAYDLLKENHQSKVRSTLGNLAISHSMPAVRLQWPYYKTKLGKPELRSFHRPTMAFPTGQPITFCKPRVVKKKHMKGKDTQAIFETTKDLSLGDNSNVLLLEYAEEHPSMLSNFGMGNRLINYYRRKNIEDTYRPKEDIGETTVLLPQDRSPFSLFGHIDPGETTPTLHNGMYRAPVFKQDPKSTDFLVIRNSTGVEGSTWYIRNVENIRVVGQEFPSVDVPGPHSRKVTTASKNRLKMISYRRIRRTKPHRVNVSDITDHFTDTTDMQNRQKMKEFMQFSKEHKEWEMRPGEAIPVEEVVRAMVKPEDVCLLESMQVGQQHLEDAGFSKGNDSDEDDEGKEGQSIEQQLAPWQTSRSFLNAAQGKAMLQLHGEGDPTGRGEAFSFIKTSMKGGFKAMGESVEDKIDAKKLKELGGHSYNVARQQRAYEESIRRIWDAQKQSLTSKADHSDTEMDTEHLEESDDNTGHAQTPRSEAQTPSVFRHRDDEVGSQFSRLSTDSQSGKVLRITRMVRDSYGNVEPQEEIVRDRGVIKLYLRRRKEKQMENIKLEDAERTGDIDQDKMTQKKLQKELDRLERNKERRIARDKQKGIYVEGSAASPGSPNSPATIKESKNVGTQRKCANCGQVGHIKTNKKCTCLSH